MKTFKLIVGMMALIAASCSHNNELPVEQDLYKSPEYKVTSHRITDNKGKVLFSAEGFSAGSDNCTDLSLSTYFPLLDSLFLRSIRQIDAGEARLPQHTPQSIWLAEVFCAADKGRESTGADSLEKYFPSRPEALPWPASSDRSSMVVAAIESAMAAGDTSYMEHVIRLSANTLRQDFDIAWSDSRSLLYGSQTYLLPQPDLYPEWMDDVDIYQSTCLGTNVSAVGAVEALASVYPDTDKSLIAKAKAIRSSIGSAFYQPNLKWFGAYQYCYPYPICLQASDNMGESIGVVLGVFSPDTAATIIENTPVFYTETPTFFPMPRSWKKPADHQAQPMVQSFRALACSKVRNGDALRPALASLIYTSATDTLSNLTSPGIVGEVCRGIFGLDFTPEGLSVDPFIPKYLKGRKELRNLPLRDAMLNIVVYGVGDSLANIHLDGKKLDKAVIPYNLKGLHGITIDMTQSSRKSSAALRNSKKSRMPITPYVYWKGPRNGLIANSDASLSYQFLVNGQFQTMLSGSDFSIYNPNEFAVINILPVYESTWIGFSQPPYRYEPEGVSHTIVPKRTKDGYAIATDLPAGEYLVTFYYVPEKETSTASLQTHEGNKREPIVFLPYRREWIDKSLARSSSAIITIGPHRTIELKTVTGKLPEIVQGKLVSISN